MLSQSTLPIYVNVLSEKKCQPEVQDDRYVFKLNLDNIFECMVTKVVDKQQVSYNRFYLYSVFIDKVWIRT